MDGVEKLRLAHRAAKVTNSGTVTISTEDAQYILECLDKALETLKEDLQNLKKIDAALSNRLSKF